MTARRLDRPHDPRGKELVTLRVDGDDVSAVRGEPVAVSLLAAGRFVLGRSVKYHRPRGAACFAGRCDGCLMRVDGVPSVRTCRLPAENDLEIETQNVLGSAQVDLLSAADWFFPGGMNHHEMFTWAKPVNQVMQLVAREVAGIGTLPSEVASSTPVTTRTVDVLVIGAGLAGLSAGAALAERGFAVWVVDEEASPGGWAAIAARAATGTHAPALERSAARARRSGVEIACGHSAIGIFDETDEGRIALVAHAGGLVRVRARAWVIATGRTEGACAFPGSDLPGVIGAEAAVRVLAEGVLPGEHVLLAGDLDVRAVELAELARALASHGAEVIGPCALTEVMRADGRNHVTSVTLERANDRGERVRSKHTLDLLVVAPRTSASYELAVQGGAKTTLREGVFEIVHTPGAHGVWVIGGAGGATRSAIDDGERAAEEIVAALGTSASEVTR